MLEELKILFPNAVNGVDYKLQDNSDGNGIFISEWNLPQPQPNFAQLNAVKVQADKARNNNSSVHKRQRKYPKSGDQFDILFKALKSLDGAGVNIGVDAKKYLVDVQKIKDDHPIT